MSSPAPQSATLPPPLHSPHSPYGKNRPSAFGSSFEDYDDTHSTHRRPSNPPHATSQPHQSSQGRPIHLNVDKRDSEPSAVTRWSASSSQPTTPCTEQHRAVAASTTAATTAAQHGGAHFGTKGNAFTAAVQTPPQTAYGMKSKDARLASRQVLEPDYTPAKEQRLDSGVPQKKDIRIEERNAHACTMSRAVFSPASAFSSATPVTMESVCASVSLEHPRSTNISSGSTFSLASTVPNAAARRRPGPLTLSMSQPAPPTAGAAAAPPPAVLVGREPAPGVSTVAAPPSQLTLAVPFPEHSHSDRSMGNTTNSDGGCCTGAHGSTMASRLSKCKRRLQGLSRPAFDLKAVEEAQCSFLEEERVCNAAQCYPLSEITPLLCIGTWKDAADPSLLRRLGIKYVLNVAQELNSETEASVLPHDKDFVYASIPMSDSHSQEIGLHLRAAFKFIERARADHSRVLVHCRRGISRSAAIVVGYLMASEHRTYESALSFVTAKRSCVSLNLAFQESLSEYVPPPEFYHGPPPPSPPPPRSSAAASAALLPSLTVTASHTEHNSNNNNGGASSHNHSPSISSSRCELLQASVAQQQRSHQLHTPASTHRRREDLFPRAGAGTPSSISSNASSRASSSMRAALSLTSVPSTTATSHSGRSSRRPRLTLATKGPNTSPSSLTVSPSTTAASSAAPVDRPRFPEDDSTSTVLSSKTPSRRCSALMQPESAAPAIARPAPVSTAFAPQQLPPQPHRPTVRGFADFSDGSNASDANDSDDGDAEEEVEEPGSPFGVGNRRAFAHFSFSPHTSSSSHNVSPALQQHTRGFSDTDDEDDDAEDDSTDHQPHALGERGSHLRHFSTHKSPQLQPPPHSRSAFAAGVEEGTPEDVVEEESGLMESDDNTAKGGAVGEEDGGRASTHMVELMPLHKSRMHPLQGCLSNTSTSTASNLTGQRVQQPSTPIRVSVTKSKRPFHAPTDASSHAGDSVSSTSHGNTTGTVDGLSSTPYGTQGSLNDESAPTPAVHSVAQMSILSG